MCPSIVLPCLLLAAAAAGPIEGRTVDPPKAAKFVVDVRFAVVDDNGQTQVDTTVSGEIGKPLVAVLGGLTLKDGNTLVRRWTEIKASRVAGGKAPNPEAMCVVQYVVELRLVECQPGKKPKVLANPTLVTTIDRPAELRVGNPNGPRIEAKILVTEIP